MRPDLEMRLWSRVDASGDCWEWTGARDEKGYGRISRTVDGQKRAARAHRVAYEVLVGPIPDGMEIDHLCRNRACLNPDHLEAVTHLTNVRRGYAPSVRAARLDRCPSGHLYAGDNLYILHGRRLCRACRARRKTEGRRRARLEVAA